VSSHLEFADTAVVNIYAELVVRWPYTHTRPTASSCGAFLDTHWGIHMYQYHLRRHWTVVSPVKVWLLCGRSNRLHCWSFSL